MYRYFPNNDNPKPIPNEEICDAISGDFDWYKADNISAAVFLISASPSNVFFMWPLNSFK